MPTPQTLLQQTFSLNSFRPGQEAVIEALLGGASALAVFPTGGGKSLCYQLPALLLEGLTLVVSPLIALMKDQVDFLQSRNIAAARLDSSLDKEAVETIYASLQNGHLKILYVSPERLKNERFVQRLAGSKISLLAIDEAHCISEWGHNFRPDYLTLADLAQRIHAKRILALTATATPAVAADICRQFSIAPQHHVQTSFSRANLHLHVTPCHVDDRIPLLLARLQAQPPEAATIIYVTLQQTAVDVAAKITDAGLRAVFYHAGLKDEEREQVQNQFMRGEVPIVVATIAFGMGIDKSDIRAVYHFNLPKSIENYVQETGRAGRDGAVSRCEMFATADDIRVLENFTYGDTPGRESLAPLLRDILAADEVFDISAYELSQRYDIRPLVLNTALTYLELDNIICATGPFYTVYKLHFLMGAEEIVQQFHGERQAFLRQLFAAGKAGRKWLAIDMGSVEEKLQQPKSRIVKAIEYLEDQGWIETAVANLRQGYRRQQDADPETVLQKFTALFEQREKNDIERIRQVITFANSTTCLSNQLLSYFGEQPDQPCGTCSCCRGITAELTLPYASHEAPLAPEQIALMQRLADEQLAVLESPRQLARFLCGLPSPATSRGKLRSHPAFGVLANAGFMNVLKNAQEVMRA